MTSNPTSQTGNRDDRVVAAFGDEWSAFDQSKLTEDELETRFGEYFALFPFERLAQAEGFDLGCGSGRWASKLAPRVGLLHCIDPAEKALDVARRLVKSPNATFRAGCADTLPFADASQDFGVCLGVLHHVPDTARALAAAARKLRPGAPFLIYLYYDFENRPYWFRALWRCTDVLRRVISRLPFGLRRGVTSVIAALVYWPMARLSLLAERAGADVDAFPLSIYRRTSFYTMRTDALDRFGTRLEQRFSRAQIADMMTAAGLTDVRFSEGPPYWVAAGTKSSSSGLQQCSA